MHNLPIAADLLVRKGAALIAHGRGLPGDSLVGPSFKIMFAVLVLSSFALQAQERTTTDKIDSISLFKNGLGVVTRSVNVDGAGDYLVENVPVPVHGTFWIESDPDVVTRSTTRLVTGPIRGTTTVDLQKDLVGLEVTVHFIDGNAEPTTGTVAALADPEFGVQWDRSYDDQNYYRRLEIANQKTSEFLVLATAQGSTYVARSRIAYVEVVGAAETVLREVPALIFTVPASRDRGTVVRFSYLTKGISWAPSYRLDISKPEQLTLSQKAVIKNELGPFSEATIRLISGFPNVRFAGVTSPLALETSWSSFFEQLRQQQDEGTATTMNAVATQQSLLSGVTGGSDLGAIPTGEGVDLHYQAIGSHTMAEGDSVALTVATETAPYERIVEWLVPDTRDAHGNPISDYERSQHAEDYEDAAWDAIQFKNPFGFPMTTGPAAVVSNGAFNGQGVSHWVNVGEQTTLRVNKALSLRTRSLEHEDATSSERQEVYVGGTRYQRVLVRGELTANNHRKEAIELVIRRRFSGDLVAAEGEPVGSLLEEGAYSVNRRNELLWTVHLAPGEEATLEYSYTVLNR